MPRLKQQSEACSVALALQLLGDRWTLLIIRDALYGVTRFQDFLDSIGLARNVLADRLAKLVEGDVLSVTGVGAGGWQAYHLTDKGRDLITPIVALMQWGDRWIPPSNRVPVVVVDRETQQPIKPLQVTSSSGKPLEVRDLAVRPGPGATLPDAQRQWQAYSRASLRKKPDRTSKR